MKIIINGKPKEIADFVLELQNRQKSGDLDLKGIIDDLESVVQDSVQAICDMGYDAKDDRLSGNPNQMNIQSMYSDIDLDANDMETELQAAFEEILWFVNAHLTNMGQGNFEGEEANIVFNRDMLMNETEVIANCQASVGILSDETIVGQHPWVDDPQLELERLSKQKEEQQNEDYYEDFHTAPNEDNKESSDEEAQ